MGHVTGRSPFFDDHLFDGLLHLRCVRSPHHAARIRRIDTTEAERMPGVVRILRGRDVPLNLNTLLSLLDFGIDDEPLLLDRPRPLQGRARGGGHRRDARRRRARPCRRCGSSGSRCPHVLDVEEAVKPGAPIVLDIYPTNKFVYHGKYDHQKLRFGDVEAAFREADHIVEGRYQMSPIEQAPIETCGAIAAPEQNGRFVCYTSTQALFFSLGTASKVLKMPSSRLHFIGGTVGGGFGGKVDSIHEPLAILGAMLTGRPVKYTLGPRGGDAGRRAARRRALVHQGRRDAGRAHRRPQVHRLLRLRAPIRGCRPTRSSRASAHLPGPYTIPNVYADVYCVYTNRTPATAMRGFGITGVDFAIEAHMDKVAETVGMNPIELRILNAYRDGDMKAHRRLAKNTALIECCQVVAEKAGIRISPEAQGGVLARGTAAASGRSSRRDGDRRDGPDRGLRRAAATPRRAGRAPPTSRAPRPRHRARQRSRRPPTSRPPTSRRRRRPARPSRRARRSLRPRRPRPPARRAALLLPLRLQEALTWRSTAAAASRRSTTRSA